MIEGENYLDTPEGQIIIGAYCYLTAARVVRHSDTWKDRPRFLLKPALHLVAHGVELLLKFPFVRAANGDVEAVRRRFGHDIAELWADDGTAAVRSLLAEHAREAWDEAKASGEYPEDDFTKDPVVELERALLRLAELHGRQTDFALRYIVGPNTMAPRPAFVVDACAPVAERLMKDPELLDR